MLVLTAWRDPAPRPLEWWRLYRSITGALQDEALLGHNHSEAVSLSLRRTSLTLHCGVPGLSTEFGILDAYRYAGHFPGQFSLRIASMRRSGSSQWHCSLLTT
jgi:hypothetical protein